MIDRPSPLLNQIKGMHFQAYKRLREEWAWLIKAQTMKAGIKTSDTPINRCIVFVSRHSSGVLPDWDGLYGGLKPVLDCLSVASAKNPSGLGIITDDSPKHIITLSAIPHHCKKENARTEIHILETEALPGG